MPLYLIYSGNRLERRTREMLHGCTKDVRMAQGQRILFGVSLTIRVHFVNILLITCIIKNFCTFYFYTHFISTQTTSFNTKSLTMCAHIMFMLYLLLSLSLIFLDFFFYFKRLLLTSFNMLCSYGAVLVEPKGYVLTTEIAVFTETWGIQQFWTGMHVYRTLNIKNIECLFTF